MSDPDGESLSYYYDGGTKREIVPVSTCFVLDRERAEAVLGRQWLNELCGHDRADDLLEVVFVDMPPGEALPADELIALVTGNAVLPVYRDPSDALFAIRARVIVNASTSAHVQVMGFLAKERISTGGVSTQDARRMVLDVESGAEALRLANLIYEKTRISTVPSFVMLDFLP